MNDPDNIDTSNNSPLASGDGGGSYSNMYYGAPPALFDKAEELRAKMTQAEEVFWNAIKINEWHLKFRRQHPVSNYVVDFYCHAVKLVIELDGGYHEQDEVKRNDAIREQNICDFGITVLRFKNEEILFHLTETIKRIDSTIQQLKRNPAKEQGPSNNSQLASGDGTRLPAIEVGSSYNSPLGDGGKLPAKESNPSSNSSIASGDGTILPAIEVRSLNNSPLGDGGKLLAKEAGSPNNSPLASGDGGKLFIIKIGGNIIDDEGKLNSFLNDFAKITALAKKAGSSNNSPLGDGGKLSAQKVGSSNNSPLGDGGKCILVHGGGKIATKIGEQLGIESKYINGRRITDEATIDLVTMVYGGLVNKKIVVKLQALNCDAIGLTGADANIIPATKRLIIYPPLEDGIKSGIQSNNALKDLGTSNNSPLGDGGNTTTKETGSSNNSPLGDGGNNTPKEIESLNNSPLGDGGNNSSKQIGPLNNSPSGDVGNTFTKEIGSLNNSPLGDGGGDGGTTTTKEIGTSNNSPLGDGGKKGGSIDYGFAGDINSATLSTKNLQMFLDNGLTPIIAPLTHDGNGQILNTNADTIASSLAVALSHQYDVRLIYCFEKKGILENVEDEKSVIPLITKEKYRQLLQEKKLFDGILPKIDNAFAAIDNGVAEVLIGDANDLLQNITEHTIGTLIK